MKKLVLALAIMATATTSFAKISPQGENCNRRTAVSIRKSTNPPMAAKAPKVPQKAQKGTT